MEKEEPSYYDDQFADSDDGEEFAVNRFLSNIVKEESLEIHPEEETDKICDAIKETCLKLGKEKAIIALSAGLDSTVVASLAMRALGKDNIILLYMPNEFTAEETGKMIDEIEELYGIQIFKINIDEMLQKIPGYEESAEYARQKLNESYKSEIEGSLKSNWVKYLSGDYKKYSENMRYLFASACIRASLLQIEGHCNNAAVITAPNKTEKDTGLYVDGGPDCNGDMQPIVHLSKMQVFQLGKYLRIPQNILERIPTADMKALPDEKSLGCPYALVDLILAAYTRADLTSEEIKIQLVDEFRRYASQLSELGYSDPKDVIQNIIDAYNLSRPKVKIPYSLKNPN